MKMKELLEKGLLLELATPSNLRLGEEIFKSGGVELLFLDENHAIARVTGGQKRTTELEAEDDKIAWKCSCLGKSSHIFCKHCVALAMAIKANIIDPSIVLPIE